MFVLIHHQAHIFYWYQRGQLLKVSIFFIQWSLPGGASYRNVSPKEMKTAAVIGAGTMGTGIAMAILNAGIPVTLIEQNQKVSRRTLLGITGHNIQS